MLVPSLIIGAIVILVVAYIWLNKSKSDNLPMVSEDVNLPATIERDNLSVVAPEAGAPEYENNNQPSDSVK